MQFSKVSDVDLSNTFRARICALCFLKILSMDETEKTCQFFDDTFSSEMYFFSE